MELRFVCGGGAVSHTTKLSVRLRALAGEDGRYVFLTRRQEAGQVFLLREVEDMSYREIAE